jgi:hypothetical protein
MVNQVGYDIDTTEGPIHITITPLHEALPDGNYYETGVYRLTDGVVGMGDIIFNEDKSDWDYDGLGALTIDEAEEIADFIKNYKDPEGADPRLLQ